MASASAHRMGFDAYIFRGFLKQAVDVKTFEGYGECFRGLPDEFFIDNLDQKITENEPLPAASSGVSGWAPLRDVSAPPSHSHCVLHPRNKLRGIADECNKK